MDIPWQDIHNSRAPSPPVSLFQDNSTAFITAITGYSDVDVVKEIAGLFHLSFFASSQSPQPLGSSQVKATLWCSSLTAPFDCTQGIELTAPLQSHRGPFEASHFLNSNANTIPPAGISACLENPCGHDTGGIREQLS